MSIERLIFITLAIISFLSMIFIPKEKVRIAIVAFLSFQTTTWFTSIILVQTGKALYPVREFVKATSVNFIPQFIFYPTIFLWFILLFPAKQNILIKVIHYFIFVSIMLWFIYLTSEYTNIYRFPNATDYSIITAGYLRNSIQYGICHLYVKWFFNKRNQYEGDAA